MRGAPAYGGGQRGGEARGWGCPAPPSLSPCVHFIALLRVDYCTFHILQRTAGHRQNNEASQPNEQQIANDYQTTDICIRKA